MNINNQPDELKKEEQKILDKLIARMDRNIEKLDNQMQSFVYEAKNANISVNPDAYLTLVLAQQGLKDTKENRAKVIQARDELYHTRLLVNINDSKEYKEIKVGLHSCMDGADVLVTSWKMPVCRHYLLDNSSEVFNGVVKDKDGAKYKTKYTLLVKNQITLRFTRVIKALNLFPGDFDEKTLEILKKSAFYNDEYLDTLIARFNPDDYDPV